MWRVLTILFIVTFSSCMSTGLVDQDELKDNSNAMKVKGRNAIPFADHKMSFGEYYTNSIPTVISSKSEVVANGVKLSKDCSEINYSIFNRDEDSLYINCNYIGDHLGVSLEDTYAHVEDELSYIVEITNNKGLSGTLYYTGYSYTPFYVNGEEYILIKDQSKDSIEGSIFTGYLFIKDDRTLAAVDTNGSGVVWVDNSLEEDKRHILAGFSSALLLRPNIQNGKS